MAEDNNFDLVVIGGGPAGYVGAIRAAQLGLKVACVERGQLGGVCLNWGCIPTKALLAQAEFYQRLTHDAKNWGIEADHVRVNWPRLIQRSREVAGQLSKGVAFLFKKNKIPHFQGHARITAPGKVEVHKPADGSESSWDPNLSAQAAAGAGLERTLSCRHILIATGAVARTLPGVTFDNDRIIGSKDAMFLPAQPQRLIIVGAGAIGMEFGYFYNALGTHVTIVEMLDRVLPIEDAEVSAAVAKSFRKQGVELLTAHKTVSVKRTESGVEVQVAPTAPPSSGGAGGAEPKTLAADKVLIAIGVRGRYEGLFSDALAQRVEVYKDHLKVDRRTYQTSLPGVYAVGDVIGPPWLAHVASEEAILCVEQLAPAPGPAPAPAPGGGHHPPALDYDSIPGCTYCQPQVASIGLTEQACREKNLSYKVGKFPFQASGKAQALGATEGFVKILSDPATGEILGAHMVGENVTELIAEMGLARRLEATAEEVIATLHAHPTLSEAVHEAALGTEGRMIHF